MKLRGNIGRRRIWGRFVDKGAARWGRFGRKRALRRRRSMLPTVPLALAAALLAGCVGGKPDRFDPDKPFKVTVLYRNESMFMREFGQSFSLEYPKAELHVVRTEGTAPDQLEALIAEKRPDVLVMRADEYESWSAKGMLLSLEPFVRETKFDTDGIAPNLVEALKAWGGGQLQGLAPAYLTELLFYNKALFERYGVPYPTAGMTWEELLMLSARFPKTGDDGKPLYGYYDQAGGPVAIAEKIGRLAGTFPTDADGKRAVIGTEAWKRLFDYGFRLYKTGNVSPRSGQAGPDGLPDDAFLNGRAAMTTYIGTYFSLIESRHRSAQPSAPAVDPKDVAAVPMPVWEAGGAPVTAYVVPAIFGIYADAPDPRAAWELVRYVNGDAFARVHAKSTPYMPARPSFADPAKPWMNAAFYEAKAAPGAPAAPRGFSLSAAVAAEAKRVQEGAATLEEALPAMANAAQAALDRANQAQR